jgi:hypothetical protein
MTLNTSVAPVVRCALFSLSLVALCCSIAQGDEIKFRKPLDLTPEQMAERADKMMGEISAHLRRGYDLMQEARKKKDIIQLNAVNEKVMQMKGFNRVAMDLLQKMKKAIAAGKLDEAKSIFTKITIAFERVAILRKEAEASIGETLRYTGETEVDVEFDGTLPPRDPTKAIPSPPSGVRTDVPNPRKRATINRRTPSGAPIRSDDPISAAADSLGHCPPTRKTVERVFDYIDAEFEYDINMSIHLASRSAEALFHDRRLGDCSDFALVGATLFRALGYSSRLVVVVDAGWIDRLKSHPDAIPTGHVLVEVYFDGRWLLVDVIRRTAKWGHDPAEWPGDGPYLFCRRGFEFVEMGIRNAGDMKQVLLEKARNPGEGFEQAALQVAVPR